MSFPVPYEQFLDAVIDGGIAEMEKADDLYADKEEQRAGGIAGFRACRGLTPKALLALLDEASERCHRMRLEDVRDDYWYHRYFEIEVEWVVNCVAGLHWMFNRDFPRESPLWPTARGTMRAHKVLEELVGGGAFIPPARGD